MGNIIGSIHWEKTSQDDIYIDELNKLCKKYNLEKDIHCWHYEPEMNNYCVEIVGLRILWYGKDNIKINIKCFLYDASQIFIKNNVEYKTREGFLPM